MGRLAVIDGLDGCGKQTQTELLATCLRQEGIPVKQITFPTYTRSSAPIELYLSGELGALDEVNVERLAQYIKRYSDGTQFIMITHRRGTMAAATRTVWNASSTLAGKTIPT